MKLKLTISIDDVNPSTNFRIFDTPVEKWLRELNRDFDATFNLFIPSNYHGKNKLSDNKTWIRELNSIPYFSCESHGHYHQTNDPKRFGECEWFELNEHAANRRFMDMYDEWMLSVDEFPSGWRSPGWLCNSDSMKIIDANFKYVAIHYDHNQGLKWNCKTFFGHDGIQQHNIDVHNGNMIMLQSHIAGNWNHNVWNEDNYQQLRITLEHLVSNYKCEFKTLKECL